MSTSLNVISPGNWSDFYTRLGWSLTQFDFVSSMLKSSSDSKGTLTATGQMWNWPIEGSGRGRAASSANAKPKKDPKAKQNMNVDHDDDRKKKKDKKDDRKLSDDEALFLRISKYDAIRTKFDICLQNSTFRALYPLTLRSSKIFLRLDIDKRVSDSKSLW